ncbi:hypothetical protein ACFO6R_14795 [Eubacterium multiforme]|uniref:Uncharacterized protein n=1 Tax=Eubacterium multiforme TaxID=83339 RepID=A0ABT9UWN3_9FIRM|nr:hypothetical protein [Eubacterium multiforme]MDQ0150701.1 hypothetical protein [Eubacterium multiforme]
MKAAGISFKGTGRELKKALCSKRNALNKSLESQSTDNTITIPEIFNKNQELSIESNFKNGEIKEIYLERMGDVIKLNVQEMIKVKDYIDRALMINNKLEMPLRRDFRRS